MAKKSMIVKNQRTPKFSTRAYTRCIVVEDLTEYLENMEFAEFVLENLQMKVNYQVLRNLVGRRRKIMFVQDKIADMLTRIRNANQMRYKEVEVPASKMKLEIARILKDEGFISDYTNKDSMIVLNLKYGEKKERVITGLKRISKPGLRVYVKAEELPSVLNGLGIAIVSTSKGVMTDKEARKLSLGGEVLAYIW